MDVQNVLTSIESVSNIIVLFLAFLIVVCYALSVYYGAKMIILKTQKRYGWCPEMLVTIESLIWLVLFGYIFAKSVIGDSPVDLDSFGVIYIRPIILISASIRSILQRRRYLLSKQKFELKKLDKQNKEDK